MLAASSCEGCRWRSIAYRQYKSCGADFMPYDVGPVMDVVSVSVRSGFGLPRHSSTVVFVGLPLRGRCGSWYLTSDSEVELAPFAVTGYGGA